MLVFMCVFACVYIDRYYKPRYKILCILYLYVYVNFFVPFSEFEFLTQLSSLYLNQDSFCVYCDEPT